MSGEVVTIYDELREYIRDALDEMNGVSIDRNGFYYSECYKDYRDVLEDSTVAEILKDSDPRAKFEDHLQWAYCDAMIDVENDVLEKIKENKNIARLNISEDELRECLCEVWYVNPPYEDFLKQEVCMDIMLDTGDCNYEFTKNNLVSTYIESAEDFEDESSLLWLCEQQGVSREELFNAFEKGTAHSDEVVALKEKKQELVDKLKEHGFKVPHFNESVIHTGAYWRFKSMSDDLERHQTNLCQLAEKYKQNDISYDDYLAMHHDKYMMLNPLTQDEFNVKKADVLKKLGEQIDGAKEMIASLQEVLSDSPDFVSIKQTQDELTTVRKELNRLSKTDDYQKAEFINSVHNECVNTYGSSVVTFLVKTTLDEAIRLQEVIAQERELNNSYYYEERSGQSSIVIDKDVRCGLMDDCSGGGSVFEIKLLKDVEIPVKALYRAVPDRCNGNYGFMEIYGADEEFFKDALKEVREAPPVKVSDLITNAEQVCEETNKGVVQKSDIEIEKE